MGKPDQEQQFEANRRQQDEEAANRAKQAETERIRGEVRVTTDAPRNPAQQSKNSSK